MDVVVLGEIDKSKTEKIFKELKTLVKIAIVVIIAGGLGIVQRLVELESCWRIKIIKTT